MKSSKEDHRTMKPILKSSGKIFWPVFLTLVSVAIPAFSMAAEVANRVSETSAKWGYIGAGIAVGASTIGAGIAVGLVGAAAMGAISERPEVAGRALIFLGLAEGIAIYGLIIAIMILGKV